MAEDSHALPFSRGYFKMLKKKIQVHSCIVTFLVAAYYLFNINILYIITCTCIHVIKLKLMYKDKNPSEYKKNTKYSTTKVESVVSFKIKVLPKAMNLFMFCQQLNL